MKVGITLAKSAKHPAGKGANLERPHFPQLVERVMAQRERDAATVALPERRQRLARGFEVHRGKARLFREVRRGGFVKNFLHGVSGVNV